MQRNFCKNLKGRESDLKKNVAKQTTVSVTPTVNEPISQEIKVEPVAITENQVKTDRKPSNISQGNKFDRKISESENDK